MSELPVAGHHLKKIEKNLGQIFPPSAQGNAPDDYEDFQATAVRSILNLETAANPRLRQISWPRRALLEQTSAPERARISCAYVHLFLVPRANDGGRWERAGRPSVA